MEKGSFDEIFELPKMRMKHQQNLIKTLVNPIPLGFLSFVVPR